MGTPQQVLAGFSPVKLDEGQKMRLQRLEVSFKDLASEIMDYAPESPDRSFALRKLLEAKHAATQSVTHGNLFAGTSGKTQTTEDKNEKDSKVKSNQKG